MAIIISDTHCGCQVGLCPPRVKLDGGGVYRQSELQRLIWKHWVFFWREWVPEVVHGKRWILVHNGDVCDGRHHGSTTQITQNLADQQKIAQECFAAALSNLSPDRIFLVRGTSVHSGETAENEERLGAAIGATTDRLGNYTRNDLYCLLGCRGNNGLLNCLHHIGTTGSTAYEASALCKEFSVSLEECARWHVDAPDWIVRSHRHRASEIRMPTGNGRCSVVVTAGWQAKTPFAFKIAGARQSQPHFGGAACIASQTEFYTRSYVHVPVREVPEYA